MPSASTTKPENKAPPEALQPINHVISVVEKKVRNLEKRKGKLDLYRSRVAEGEELNQDQQEAIARYDAVLQNLEFARELQKQFLSIQAEAEKIYRMQTRMQRQDRNANEVRRMKELLQLQSILDHLGSDNVRSDFLTGNHGAVVLTEENLKQLDELYKLISPSRDGEKSYVEEMTAASKHIVNFIDSRDRNVAGTTYRALKELVDKINECGYFENLPNYEAEAETEKEDAEAGKVENAETKEYENVPESSEKEEEIANKGPEALQNEVPQSVLEPVDAKTQSDSDPVAFQAADLEKESFFTTPAPAVPFSRQRPINEIVSSVQGTFNFLQDSHIDMESPHMDPAVVVARPMGGPTIPHPAQQTDSALSQSNYQGSNLLGNDDQISQQQVMSTQQSSHPQAQTLSSETIPGDTVPPSQQQLTSTTVVPSSTQPQNNTPVGQQSLDGAAAAAYSTEQDYGHDLMTQSLQNTSQIAFGADQSGFTASSHPGMDQSVSGISSTPPGDVPPAIPLPSQTLQGSISLTQSLTDSTEASESSISQESQEKKPFSMNPNAAMFTSMYQPHNMSSVPQASSHMASNNNTVNAEDKFAQSVQQNDYQNSGYGFGRNGNGPRGGQRGGSRGVRGMSNGFAGRGNRNGPTYSGGRGGFNGRGNGRGAYQGYPPRSDYRPDGFQGFSNGFGFNKRGSGPSRGGVRGGAMRGGPPRGGMRGNNRGGFGSRPNNGPQPGSQTVQQAAA